MDIKAEVKGIAELNVTLNKIAVSDAALLSALDGAGALIETACKQQAPVDTGRLRASIVRETSGKTVIVAPHTDYAAYVEFGTSKMGAQPYMKPGFESSRSAAIDHIKRRLGEAVKVR